MFFKTVIKDPRKVNDPKVKVNDQKVKDPIYTWIS